MRTQDLDITQYPRQEGYLTHACTHTNTQTQHNILKIVLPIESGTSSFKVGVEKLLLEYPDLDIDKLFVKMELFLV